jgi:hypothetical protein
VASAAIDRRRVTATVRNFGATPRTADVHATIDDSPMPARQVTIPANDALEVTFDSAADATRAALAIDDADGYPADNERFAIAESRTLPRVLIVGGGPAAAGGFYLTKALQAEAEEGADFDVRTVTGSAFAAMTAEQLREQSVVALLSTHGIDRRAGEPLRAFLKGGGGLFVAAAADVDPAVLSTLLEWQPPLVPRDIRAGRRAGGDRLCGTRYSVRSTRWPRTSDRWSSIAPGTSTPGPRGASSRASPTALPRW